MLSILIPIYNYDVTDLVQQLSAQASTMGQPYEILVYDDASESRWQKSNASLATISRVTFTVLANNHGRAKIRNLLASAAHFDHLLFMDCDSGILKSDFLKTYMDLLPFEGVLAGGRSYAQDQPSDPSHTLHWLYGHKKESRTLAERQAAPAKYFHSNNFIVSKSIIQATPFDESIKGYGYEDLAWAVTLETKGISVTHLENAVLHLGLEDADVFLSKTCKAIDNLIALEKSGVDISTNLQSFAGKIDLVKMRPIVQGYYKWKENSILANLASDSPKLSNLDLYKLNYYFSRS